MAHPYLHGKRNFLKQRAAQIRDLQQRWSVFTVLRRGHPAAEVIGQQLHAIADAQHRLATGQDIVRELRGVGIVHAIGPAAEDEAPRLEGQYLLGRRIIAE